MTGLAALANAVRAQRGLAHKADIAAVLARLPPAGAIRNGDDCAAIADGDGFLLFSIEGFLPDFVAADPRFAGWCGVMVNLSDIAAMGGRPVAVVDALWSDGISGAAPLLAGLAAAAKSYGVPIAGGHTNARASQAGLAVAVLGRARRLLTSFDARPGDTLIAAVDLRGRFRDPHPFWDAATGADPRRLRDDLAILPCIAEDTLCAAAKDISMAGAIGTAMMLLETSGCGAVLDPWRLPRPDGVALDRWIAAFPSFGFVLAASPASATTVVARFEAVGIAAAAFGTCDGSGTVRLRDGSAEEVLWRFADTALIGAGVAA